VFSIAIEDGTKPASFLWPVL